MRQLAPKKKKRENNSHNNRNGKGNENPKEKKEREASFLQRGGSNCWCCGKPGYNSRNYPKKDDIARNKWHDRSGVTHYQESNERDNNESQRLLLKRERGGLEE